MWEVRKEFVKQNTVMITERRKKKNATQKFYKIAKSHMWLFSRGLPRAK
jgi:hypothetical protein